MITCAEIAKKLDIANSTVMIHAKKVNAHYTYETVKGHKQIVFDDDTVLDKIKQSIADYWNKPKRYTPKSEAPEKKQTIEELRALHPLVKNDKFLITSYFPEV